VIFKPKHEITMLLEKVNFTEDNGPTEKDNDEDELYVE
jgi:hypothetical protein